MGGRPDCPGSRLSVHAIGMSASLRAFGRRLARRGPGLALYATAVILVPLGLSPGPREPLRSAIAEAPREPATPAEAADVAQQRALAGIWWRYEAGLRGEPVRFYYFHGDGTGLYRYGKVGLNNTHSFDYDVVGERLVLDFRKSGEHHEVAFTLRRGRAHGEARDWLELDDDPSEPGSTRYFREPAALGEPGARTGPGGIAAPGGIAEPAAQPTAELGPAPAGHMWIDLQAHATGGRTFAIYQLRAAGIDGRGVGWFHRGDFDDWSTEALTYRIVGDRLELDFTLSGQFEVTGFSVRTEGDGTRWLALTDDPRDFWHPHRYLDMGPSFGAALAPFEIATER